MKKVLSLLAVLVITVTCAFALVGCGESSARVKVIDVNLSEIEHYGIAVSKTNNDLLTTINDLLEEKADDVDAIIAKYIGTGEDTETDFPAVEGVVTYTDSMAGNNNYLVMATDAPFEPYEFRVGNGYAGIDIEIGKMIANKLGKTLAIKQTQFDTICTVVNQGGADIGLAGLTITETRRATVNFSTPYQDAYQVLVVPAENTTFDNKTSAEILEILRNMEEGTKAGSQAGTTGAFFIIGDMEDEDGFGFEGFPNLEYKSYTTHADAVRDMLNGSVEFCVVDNAVAKSIVAEINKAS
ncbi:MAG: transporter substrate-binding domain-containing protein [Clostridiales bacterium]|nr:transporter substrate-binding domain-containing protein [Clostridiales bacterium]